ncbi:MAG: FadR/GntR family transcriptional regulator [Acidiferrobacterales bacterium]
MADAMLPNRIPKPEESGEIMAKRSRVRARVGGSAGITAYLRRQILNGGYAYSERLPPERQLAAQFGASRGTVRAALQRLEEMNLVSRRVGSGTFVRYRGHADHEDIAELTSPLELIEVRLAVEPQMARLAAVNASARDLERMADALRRVEAAGDDPEYFTQGDAGFHLALAACTRNPLMIWVYRQINDVRGHKQWSAMKDKILTAERIKQYNIQHRALFKAVYSRDVDGAVGMITAHLEKARCDLLGVEAG